MNPTAESSLSNVSRKKRHWGIWITLVFLILPAALLAGYTWVTLHFAYSSGDRAGYIQKISKKGWLCKTWEGELAMVTLPGTVPQIFPFSVRDDSVAHQIQRAAGQRVALTYEEHRGVPTSCFGETKYFVTGVRPIGQ